MGGQADDTVAALDALEAEAERAVGSARGSAALSELRTEYLGRKAGRLTAILKTLAGLDNEAKRVVGARANAVKAKLEALFDAAQAAAADAEQGATAADLSMPARTAWRGARHPMTLATERITSIFRELGFTRYIGPEAETEWHNFLALNFPPEHPAMDMHDTLYLGDGVLLRTHTSPLQIRAMTEFKPPIRILCGGMCYRKDPFDASHAPAFAQIEGLCVDEGITFVDLKATLTLYARKMFAPDTKVRFRPSFFPFTEPSAELDVECQICHGGGCPTCKGTGWAELLGCGMVHPRVLENCGIDSERYTGWAFGMGPGRTAQQLFGINDIRLQYEADMRLSAQFVDAS